MEFRLFRCAHCGNIVMKLVDNGVPVSCCGTPMVEMKANATDGALEKHVPVVEKSPHGPGYMVSIKVGEVEHPMVEEHYIQFIAAVDGDTVTLKFHKPGEHPVLDIFTHSGDVTAYEYCNLHGYWKSAQ